MEKILAAILFVLGLGVTIYVLYNASKTIIKSKIQKKIYSEKLNVARNTLNKDNSVGGKENNLFLLRNKKS